MMKKTLLLLVSLVGGMTSVFAYTPTTEDHTLLNAMFQRIETMFLHDTQQLLKIYEAFPGIQAQYSLRPQHAYILERMMEHIKLVLFTSVYEDKFVCLPTYVQEGDSVEMNYAINATDGTIVATSRETMKSMTELNEHTTFIPVAFNPGKGQVLPWFDAAALWAQEGKKVVFMMNPEDAFGARNATLLKIVSRTSVEEEIGPLEEGKPYTLTMSLVRDGETLLAVGRIVDITAENVTIDFNHPYAGQDLLGTLQIERLKKGCSEDVFPLHKGDVKNEKASSATDAESGTWSGTGTVRQREFKK